MDIFLPQQPDLHDLPVLLFMHGGAWTHGTKNWCGRRSSIRSCAVAGEFVSRQRLIQTANSRIAAIFASVSKGLLIPLSRTSG
jgi:hypothetical protein